MTRASWTEFSAMAMGFLVAAGKGSQIPPFDCNSLTMRPPREATRLRPPACASASAMSMVARSAPPD